jgi:hypothetical protein
MVSCKDLSTKTSTAEPQEKEPVPSFMKALSFANDVDDDINNETFSNISAGIVMRTKSENLIEDEECSPMMVVESFGDNSIKTS